MFTQKQVVSISNGTGMNRRKYRNVKENNRKWKRKQNAIYRKVLIYPPVSPYDWSVNQFRWSVHTGSPTGTRSESTRTCLARETRVRRISQTLFLEL